MPIGLNENDIIGTNLKIKMVTGETYDGVVYSYIPDRTIVLMSPSRKGLQILQVVFIDSVEPGESGETLPSAIDGTSTDFPRLIAGSGGAIRRYYMSKFKNDFAAREGKLNNFKGAPFQAVECFLCLEKVYPNVKYDEGVILVGDINVVVHSENNWEIAKVNMVQGKDDHNGIVGRVKKTLSNAHINVE
eukprot:Tbor_TRINITY_DN5446_c1_g4::TRINITY_DN5446_c1_g4_i1::g.25346::m.25346